MMTAPDAAADPIALFAQWLKEAEAGEPADPNAMALATASKAGEASVRIVLLRGFGEQGFEFHTHYTSRKGRDLEENPRAALCFYWKSLEKQVRISGTAEKLPAEDSDAYFSKRQRRSQLGAWASQQSGPLENYDALMRRLAAKEEEYKGHDVPRPPHWGGYRLIPERMEFWINQPNRLHHRFVFTRAGKGWKKERLNP